MFTDKKNQCRETEYTTQSILNLDKPIVQSHPLGKIFTIKRNHRPAEYRKPIPDTAIYTR